MLNERSNDPDLDERYRRLGWKRVQLGEVVIYQRPLSSRILARVAELSRARLRRTLLHRALDGFGLFA
jgi:hypothetical protein